MIFLTDDSISIFTVKLAIESVKLSLLICISFILHMFQLFNATLFQIPEGEIFAPQSHP